MFSGNHEMGYIFEELLRRFSEMSNETAGEHYTPREVIRLMVNLLFAEHKDELKGTGIIRTVFDPACGTGGMLTIPGIRFRVHRSRKSNGTLDRYFFIRYRLQGKLKEEGIGWSSEGWNAQRASLILSDLKKAHLTGEGPQTLAEKRDLENEKKEMAKAEQERMEKENLTFSHYFTERYFPEAKINKHWRSYSREESLFKIWIAPVIGKMPFKDIRPFHLERIKKNMFDAEKAPRSIQYALAVVRQIFNHAIRNDIFMGDNPARKVKKPKVDNRRIRFLTHEES